VPACELTGLGESGVDFTSRFSENGIEDLINPHKSDALFAVWRAPSGVRLDRPYLHRAVELRQSAA